jgi:hypothetical protein
MSDIASNVPSTPKSIPLRPLKGMYANVPPQQIPVGAGKRVINLYARPEGLQRRDALQPLISTATLGKLTLGANEVVQDIVPFYSSAGAYVLLAITNKRMYQCVGDGVWTSCAWGQAYYAVTEVVPGMKTVGLTVTSGDLRVNAGTSPTGDWVRVGDKLCAYISGVWTEYTIATIPTANSVTLVETPAIFASWTGSKAYVVREFSIVDPYLVDFTYMTDKLVLVDGSNRSVWAYNGDHMEDLKVHDIVDSKTPNYLGGAQTVMYFNGLLFLGKTVETDPEGKHIVRWSQATDVATFSRADYVRFNREASPVLKLSAVEDVPIVYLESAIYAGFPSDLTGLPYQFDKIESGGVSAVGMRAMTPTIGGQVFVGYNNIYLLQPGRTGVRQQPLVQAIGDRIAPVACAKSLDDPRCRAFFDAQRDALAFTFTLEPAKVDGHVITSIFYYFVESKEWCECQMSRMTAVSIMPYTSSLMWSTIDAWLTSHGNNQDRWDNTALAAQWYSFRAANKPLETVFASSAGIMHRLDATASGDAVDSTMQQPIVGCFESGEMDFDLPDDDKIINHLSVRVDDTPSVARSTDLLLDIETSSRRGQWSPRGTITIEAGTFEDDCSFRERGSLFAFRLRFNVLQPPFRLNEFVTRARVAGLQITRGR